MKAHKSTLQILIPVFLLIIFSYGLPYAQVSSESLRGRFTRSLSLYQAGRYEQAVREFSELAAERPVHPWSSVSVLLQAQSLYNMKEYHAAVGVLQGFERRFPDSKYEQYACYVRGNAYYRLDEYQLAFRQYVVVCSGGSDGNLTEDAARESRADAFTGFYALFLDGLEAEYGADDAGDIIRVKRAQVLLLAGRPDEARKILKPIAAGDKSPAVSGEVSKLLAYIRGIENQPLIIGVVLNITNAEDDESRQFFSGLKLAIDEFSRKSEKNVSLVLKNAEGSSIKAIKATRSLAGYRQSVAIVGPLESEFAIASAASLVGDEYGVSFLVPRVQNSGVAALSPWIFQLAADYETEGRVMGNFAAGTLGLKSFATLSPVEKDAQELTASFTASMKRNGGIEIDREIFYPLREEDSDKTINLDRQFSNMRKASWAFRPEKRILSSELTSRLDSLEAAYFGTVQTRQTGQQDSLLFDTSLDIPITSLDALYMPVNERDIKYVAPKIALYNFRTQLLGASDWNSSSTLSSQSNYINGVYFTAKNAINEYDMDFINFRNLYRQKVHASPENMAVYGYDCGNLIVSCLRNEAFSREQFKRSLSAVNDFSGITGRIRFDGSGANNWVPIARYREGVIEYVQDK